MSTCFQLLGEMNGNNSLDCFGSVLDSPDQQFERKFLMPGTGVFIRYFMAVGGALLPYMA